MRKLIEKIIFDYGIPLSKQYHDESCDFENQVIEAFMDFGKQVCELQKKECADKAEIIDNGIADETPDGEMKWFERIEIDEDSILNCKNVCE